MRAIDYLETRPEVDAKRVGIMGISGGGTISLFTAALDARIHAAYVSCYFCSFKESVLSFSHCIDNYVPGILNWAEMSDVAALIAPRYFFAESGIKDPIFPVAAARESFVELRKAYETMGVPERCAHEVFDGQHVFHGREGWPFVRKALGLA
jgi:dienelactone hydrolase